MLKPWELEQYTLSEFLNALHGYNKARAEEWAQARLVSYYVLTPHLKKNAKLKLTDIMELHLIDGEPEVSTAVAKVYKLTPEEIKQWHAGTWKPNEELH